MPADRAGSATYEKPVMYWTLVKNEQHDAFAPTARRRNADSS